MERVLSDAAKFSFEDFTIDNYQKLLKYAVDNYEFVNFSNYKDSKSPFLLWRHDVDIDFDNAVNMAEIECKLGVSSTFFILLHSEFYNLFDLRISSQVRKIVDLGHNIGLHFDASYYDISSEEELESKIILEKNVLQNILNIDVKSFSFHITSNFTMSCQKERYGGLINVYSNFFQNNIRYCSDSNGIWRHERLEDFLKDKIASAQVLTHPIWWSSKIKSPYNKFFSFLRKRSFKDTEYYLSMLERTGRSLID